MGEEEVCMCSRNMYVFNEYMLSAWNVCLESRVCTTQNVTVTVNTVNRQINKCEYYGRLGINNKYM